MTAPDPLECLNLRMARDESLCGEPESAHCEGCRMCPGPANCICHTTPTDGTWLNTALDAFARNGNAASWDALQRTISHSCADSYRSDIAAAIAPLQDEIRRLTAAIENLKPSKETP